MTSVRTCYCKHEENTARKKDNDVTIHNGNRRTTTGVSKKPIVTNRTYGSSRESCKTTRHVTNEKTPDTNRSTEATFFNPVLTPETSIALENAEKIVNNAKMQLMEVCATSNIDFSGRNRNTCLLEPPLDDETEERLYVRELVASKFYDACSSRLSQANSKASARSEKQDFSRAIVRRIDLSAPKFRMSRRRPADWSSLEHESADRSRDRALPARVSSKDLINVENETARDDRARQPTPLAQENEESRCRIQIGPSLHIVNRELTRQDLDDVHISPESSQVQSRANTATYTVCYDVGQDANDPEKQPRTRPRLDMLQGEESMERSIIEIVSEAAPTDPANEIKKDLEDITSFNFEKKRVKSQKIHRQEEQDKEIDPQNVEEAKIYEGLKNTNRETTKFAVIDTSRTDNSKILKNKVRNENREGIASGGDTENRKVFSERSDADDPRNDENIVDKIQEKENQDDRSKPLPAGDTSRKTGFSRRENISLRCQEMEASIPYRTIDGYVSNAFNSHNAQDVSHINEDARYDSLDEIELYRPHLDDLDSILHSNDRKIERVVRTTRNLSQLLSNSEFAVYKLDEDNRGDANREKLCRDSSAKGGMLVPNKPARSSILKSESRNEDLTVSEINNEKSRTNTAGAKSSFCGAYSKSSSVFPVSDATDDARTSRDSDNEAEESAAKASLSELSIDNRSDVTTFSNLVPALSSTRTETQTYSRKGEIANQHPGTKPRFAGSGSKLSKREISHSGNECANDRILAQVPRKDTDRFIAYILQDEKQSIEGKIMNALKESAITPAALQKLLDHLREAESIRDARQMEALDILRNILDNIKSQFDRGNNKEIFSQNIPNFSIQEKASITIDRSRREEKEQEIRMKIDSDEIGRTSRNFYELKSPDRHSEFRETKDSVRSTVYCESTRDENNSKKDTSQVKSADVAKMIDAENPLDENVNKDDSQKKEIVSQNVVEPFPFQTNEETVSQMLSKNNVSGAKVISDKFKDSSISFALPEPKENSVYLESARGSKNNSKSNSKGNSEAESLKQISDIRSDDDGNLKNSEDLSLKISSAKSERKLGEEAIDPIFTNKKADVNKCEKKDKTSDAVDRNQDGIITPTEVMIAKSIEVRQEERDVASADKKVFFAFSENSERRNEEIPSNASPARSKFTKETATITDIDSAQMKIDLQYVSIKDKADPVNNGLADCQKYIAPKSSESSLQEVTSRNKWISPDTVGGGNSMRSTRHEKIRGSMTIEKHEDKNDISGKIAQSQSIDLMEKSRDKIKVSSSSTSSIGSTLLDHDDRSSNGTSSANAKRAGTTPETSHSEGELYMPSSCSYSLGEVRVLRRKHDSVENNTMERDSSMTVLVTRSMLTSLNDSTVSLLESFERV